MKTSFDTRIVQKEVFFCECAIYEFVSLVRAKNHNELLQTVPLFTANNVCFGFIRYVRYIRYIRLVFVIFVFLPFHFLSAKSRNVGVF